MASTRLSNGEPQNDTGVDLRVIVGANIRARRDELGLKNRELADSVGIEIRLLSKHMKGEVMPQPSTLVLYARRLTRPVSWFFDEHEEKAA